MSPRNQQRQQGGRRSRRALPVLTPEDCKGCGACCQAMGHPVFCRDRPGWRDLDPAFHDSIEEWLRLPEHLKRELDEHLDRLDEEYRLGLRPRADDGGEPCIWLQADGTCRHYEHRPSVCREFETGGDECRAWRREMGMDGA